MRIVFMGSPAPAIYPLESLLASKEHEVVAVVSQPARPSGRKRQLLDPPVAAFAKERGLTVWQPEKARAPEFLQQLAAIGPDVVVTAAYGQILSQAFLDIPTRATINIHPSLLPEYRGAIPVPATLLDGRKETGVTILFTVKALDAGHVIARQVTPIAPEETAEVLLNRLFQVSGDLLLHALSKLSDPSFVGEPQDESRVTHCTKIAKEDGLVDWKWGADKLWNRFRAFQPWPGLYTYLGDKRLTIVSVTGVGPGDGSEVGSFLFDKSQRVLLVATGSGTLLVERVKPEGGNVMDAASFWNGLKDKSQLRFSSHERASP